MSFRRERVRELLKREIGEILRRELPISQAGVVSVNDVLLAPDLHSATVFVSLLGSADQKKRAAALLESERKRLQGLLGGAVVLKYTPQLKFVIDESIERGNRVLAIIEEFDKSLPPESE